jgi:hypothetical protein
MLVRWHCLLFAFAASGGSHLMVKRITVLLLGHVTRLSTVYSEFPSENLPQPDVIRKKIIEDVESAQRRREEGSDLLFAHFGAR